MAPMRFQNSLNSSLQFVLALLALTAIACGLSAAPTPTPAPTPTLTRSQTPVPTLTPTPEGHPTGQSGPSSLGVTVTGQPDGTTLFVDLDTGFQFTLPENWVPVMLSVNGSLTEPEQVQGSYPELGLVVASMQSEDPDSIRLLAIQAEAQYRASNRPTLLLVTVYNDIPAEMMVFGMAGLTAWIEDMVLSEAGSLAWEVRESATGIEIGVNDASYDDLIAPVRVHILSFVDGGKLVTLQIMTPPQFGDALFEQSDAIIDTIHLVVP